MTVGELLVRLGADFSQFNKDIAQAERQTRAAGLRMSDIFKNAFSFTIGLGMFEAISSGFRAVIGIAVDFNSMMEQAQIGFITMLGSAEKAQAFLEEMGKFAAETPFEYPDLLLATRRMMAMGFAAGEVLPTLRAVGDAAAGLGLGKEGIDRITLALGQMRAKAKVSAEEMLQLTEAGVPAWDILAQTMGKSTAEVMKLAEKGLIPASDAIKALVEGMEARFPGMMGKLASSWQGVTSTIKDVWRMTIGAVTQTLFAGMVNWLKGIRDAATSFYDFFSALRKQGVDTSTALELAIAKTFGPGVASAISGFVNAIRTAWAIAVQAAVAIKTYWSIIKPLIMGAVIAFLMFRVVIPVISGVTMVMQALNGTLVSGPSLFMLVSRAVGIYRLQLSLASAAGIAHIGVLQVLRTALYSVWAALGPLGVAILGVSAALTAGVMAWGAYAASVERANLQKAMSAVSVKNAEVADSNQGVADSSQQAADGMNKQADATEKAGKAAGKNIQSFDEVHQIMDETAASAKDAASGLDNVTAPQLEVPGGGMSVPELNLQDMLEQAKPTWAGFWNWMKEKVVSVWDGIKNAIKGAWDWIVNKTEPVWSPMANFFSSLWGGIKTVAITAWQQIGNILFATWQAMVNIGTGVWQVLAVTVTQIWNSLQVAAQTVFGAIYNFVVGTWSNFYTAISTIWNAVWLFLSTLWNNIWIMAGTIWQAIADLITGKIDLRTAVTMIWGAITAFLSGTWDSIKAMANTIWSAISQFITNKWTLIQITATTIWSAIAQFFSDTWNAISNAAQEIWTIIATNLQTVWQAILDAATAIWESIKNAIREPMEAVKALLETIMESIKDKFSSTWEAIKVNLDTVWNSIKVSASDIWHGVYDTIRGAINLIINAINKFIDGFNRIEIRVPEIKIPFVGTFGGWTIRVPQIPRIPYLAEGGIVMSPTLAMIGESGPEAVIPLGKSGFGNDMANSIAKAVYVAIRDAFRVIQAEQGVQRELILEIDGRRVARAIIPSLISEGQRTGLPVIVRGG